MFASSQSRLEQSIRATLEELRVSGIKEPTANAFKLFRTWLLDRKRQRKWLIVVDNADDAGVLLSPSNQVGVTGIQSHTQLDDLTERSLDFLPYSEHGSILLTSRSREVALKIVHPDNVVDIDPMDQSHALALLRQKLGRAFRVDEDDLVQLVTELGSMPLALTQAAAYIRERAPRFSVKDYLKELSGNDGSRLKLLNHDGPDIRRDSAAQNCVLKTLQISFEHIRRSKSSAADLLALMSFCDRHAIPEMLLHNRGLKQDPVSADEQSPASTKSGSPHSSIRKSIKSLFRRQKTPRTRGHTMPIDQGDTQCGPSDHFDQPSQPSTQAQTDSSQPLDTFDDDLQVLRNYSLVTVTTDPSEFEMHRLVQLATQDWLKLSGSFQRWGTQFITNLDAEFPTWGPHGFLQHIDTCSKLYSHTVAAMNIKLDDLGSILCQANVVTRGGRYADRLGGYTDCLEMDSLVFERRLKILGPQHPDTLESMHLMGVTYRSLGQYEKAETLQTEVLHQYERL